MTQTKEELLKKHFGHAYGTLHPLMQIAPTLAAMEELETKVREEYALPSAPISKDWKEAKIRAAAAFGKANLVFTDDLKDFDERQVAGFLEGAKWMEKNVIAPLQAQLKAESECVEHMKEVCDGYEAQLKPSPATPVEGEAERILVQLVQMKRHRDSYGKTAYYEENKPLTWRDAFAWYDQRAEKIVEKSTTEPKNNGGENE